MKIHRKVPERCYFSPFGLNCGAETPAIQARNSGLQIRPIPRVAGLGRLSAGAKMAMKPFFKRVFTIFATDAPFLRVITNLLI